MSDADKIKAIVRLIIFAREGMNNDVHIMWEDISQIVPWYTHDYFKFRNFILNNSETFNLFGITVGAVYIMYCDKAVLVF